MVGGQGPLSPEVCFCCTDCHPGGSRCSLSAGAQVKAALWIPLGAWDGPPRSAGSGQTSEWLPEDLVSSRRLVGGQEEKAGKDMTGR